MFFRLVFNIPNIYNKLFLVEYYNSFIQAKHGKVLFSVIFPMPARVIHVVGLNQSQTYEVNRHKKKYFDMLATWWQKISP
jgi:hypothetical protein